MASYLLSLLLPSPSTSYNSLNNARNGSGFHMEQQEKILYNHVYKHQIRTKSLGDLCNYSTNAHLLVLDSGRGADIISSFATNSDPLWSARALSECPEAIKKVNLSFLQHGSDVVCTNTYQASIKSFQDHLKISNENAEALMRFAVKLATEIRDEFWNTHKSQNAGVRRKKPQVVGSVGPYGAYQHDASEYTGDYVDRMSIEELQNWHRDQVEILVDSGVDLIAFETIPAQKEAEALSLLLNEFPGTKAWLSFSCKDEEHTCHGEKFSEAVSSAVVHNSSQIVAVGLNCCSPRIVKSLLQSIHGKIDLPFVVYPNSGEEWKDGGWHDTGKCGDIASHIPEWVEQGARWIGGCCRTTPSDIAEIRDVLCKWTGN